MDIKHAMKTNEHTKELYNSLHGIKRKVITMAENKRDFCWHGLFDDRQKGRNKLCMVLAGYKSFLYGATFERLKAFLDDDIDVCVITSGLNLPEIQRMCQTEGWSYLSTKENNVSLVQNVAIKLHPNAEWIFKLDEDIFVTENYFGDMLRAYEHADKGLFNPGIIAPLIPVNGYGYIRVLQKLNKLDVFSERFEPPQYSTGNERSIEGDPEAATFMWGAGGIIPSIDEMNRIFKENELEERVCPIRFSIGAILFRRELWEKMRHFTVKRGNGMGQDEVQVCGFCAVHNRPIMVSENIVVGHLSFGPQNAAMKEYFMNNPEKFYI